MIDLMRICAAAVTLSFVCPPVQAQEVAGPESPRLTLTTEEWAAQVGDSVRFELRLELPGVKALADNRIEGRMWSGFPKAPGEYYSDAGPEFIRNVLFEPQVEGDTQVGPLELDLGGNTIRSNAVPMKVFPGWAEGETGYRFRLSSNSVKVGEPFYLTVWQHHSGSQVYDRTQLSNDRPESAILLSRERIVTEAVATEPLLHGDHADYVYDGRDVFRLVCNKPGELWITREFFNHLPEEVTVPELIVEVVEAKEE